MPTLEGRTFDAALEGIDQDIEEFGRNVEPLVRGLAALAHLEEPIVVPLIVTATGLTILGVGTFALVTSPISAPAAIVAGGILGVTGAGITGVGLDLGATQINSTFGTT